MSKESQERGLLAVQGTQPRGPRLLPQISGSLGPLVSCHLIENKTNTNTPAIPDDDRRNPSDTPSLHRDVRVFPRCRRRHCRRRGDGRAQASSQKCVVAGPLYLCLARTYPIYIHSNLKQNMTLTEFFPRFFDADGCMGDCQRACVDGSTIT